MCIKFKRELFTLIIEDLNRMDQSDCNHRSRVNHNLGTAIHRIKLLLFVRESPRSVYRYLSFALSISILRALIDLFARSYSSENRGRYRK